MTGSATPNHAAWPPVERREHRGRAAAAQLVRQPCERANVNSGRLHHGLIAERDPAAIDGSAHPLARDALEASDLGEREIAILGRTDDRGGEGMLAQTLETGREPQKFVLAGAGRFHRHNPGLAFGQRAGLVDDQRIDLFQPLERFGVLDQNPGMSAPSHPNHDRHRRRQTQRARAGDDQNRDRRDQSISHARRRPEDRPRGEGENRDRDNQGHEPARDLVGEALDGRAAALRFRHHPNDLGQHGLAADPVCAHYEGAARVHRSADHPIADRLADRHRFPGQHGLIDCASPLDDFAVHWDLLAWPHPQCVADPDLVEGDLFVRAIRMRKPRGLRRKVDERADRAASLIPRPEFEHLSEQHQGGDDRRRLEIDRDGAMAPRNADGNRPGATVATTL